jgi:hypothetical protein
MLDRIGDMLEEAQIRYARLDGTMTREDRAKACDDLKFNKKVEILLVSTRAGGVGLNLTAASRCFLVDPYWNPSVEAQAIDRIVSFFPIVIFIFFFFPSPAPCQQSLMDRLLMNSTEWVRLDLLSLSS